MKNVLRIAAALAVLVLAYVLIAFAIGRVIVSETRNFAEALALQDGVTVRRLDYEARILGGVLRYELDYAPPADSLPGMLDWRGVRNARGEMAVRHGPWVGNGFALAAGDGRTEVPEAMRAALPELSAEQSLLDVKLRYNFDRSVRADFAWLEHEGPLQLSEGLDARGTVSLKGANGWAQFDASLNWLDFNYGVESAVVDAISPAETAGRMAFNGLRVRGELERAGVQWTGTLNTALDEFEFAGSEGMLRAELLLADALFGVATTADGPRPSLRGKMTLGSFGVDAQGPQPSTLRVDGLRGEADLLEDWPHLWSGTASLHAGNAEASNDGLSVRIDSVSLDSSTRRTASVLDQALTLKLGTMHWGHAQVGGARLVISLKGIDGQSLSQLVELASLNTMIPPQATDQAVQQAMMAAAETTFAGTPAVAIDHAGLSVLQDDDVRSKLALSLTTPASLPLNWLELPARLRVQGGFTARLDAVNQLFRLGAEAEQHGRGGDADAVRDIGDARYAEWLAGMRELPYVTVTADSVTSEIGYTNDVLTLNGRPVDPMLLLLVLAMLGEALGP